jgi:hypothetical protein
MSEKKFSSKELMGQLRQVPDLAYEFSNEEILEGVNFFIKYAGYTFEEQRELIPGGPDFSAFRKEPEVTRRIIGVLRRNMKEVAEGVTYLLKIKEKIVIEGQVEYAIVLPPVQERHLIDYMKADNNKLYRDLQLNGFMLWLCNPKEKSVFCAQGASKDKRVNEYFRMKPAGSFLGRLAAMPYASKGTKFQEELLDSLEK